MAKVIDSYTVTVNNIVVDITIQEEDELAVPQYILSITNISETTKIILEKIRQEFISHLDNDALERAEDERGTDAIKIHFEEEIRKLIKKYFPETDAQTESMLVNYLVEENLGLGKIEIVLKDSYLEEIVINNSDEPVWVYHRKHAWLQTNIKLINEGRIRHYAMQIGREVGKEITTLNPLMDAHLSTGDRVNATLSPISSKGNTITIRKFAEDPTAFAEVMARTADMVEPGILAYRLVLMARDRLSGPIGSEVELTLRDGQDHERVLTLERVRQPGVMNQLGNLPPLRVRLEHELVEHASLHVGLIRFNIWLLPIAAEFDAAIERYREADAIVVDLRGNLGGVGGMAMGLAGHFLDEPLSLGEMRTRQSVLHFRANPRRVNPAGERVRPFAGPVAVLQDGLSMSTSEIFAGGLQRLGRARVFGETSGGAALPSRIERLPCGDALQFAFADFVDPEGVRLEGRGVIPDEVAPMVREELLAGSDAPLEAALRWIEQTLVSAMDR